MGDTFVRIAYIILHYMAGKDTVECVESILTATRNSIHETLVIIVDNGSTNNSLDDIKNLYSSNENIKILHSEKNLGFAKGNNIGFSYAKKKYRANFIIQLNNDTIIDQSNFNEIVIEKYYSTNYAVLGPDIITADGFHQNPLQEHKWTKRTLRIARLKKRIRIIFFYFHLNSIVKMLQKQKVQIYRKEKIEHDVKNTMLHGACLIFSPKYIDRFEGLDPRTFLYMEEDILKLYMDHYGMLMVYSGELVVYHKEDVSTNQANMDERVRLIWSDKNIIASSKIYEQIKKELSNDA